MSTKVDIALIEDENGVYDVRIGDDGDFVPIYGFDTAIIMSLLSEARADTGDVNQTEQRRGWIGNETPTIPGLEVGSKLWLECQSRRTLQTKNAVVDHAKRCFDWLVPDYLDAVDVTGNLSVDGISITVIPTYKSGKTDKLLFELWNNTGVV